MRSLIRCVSMVCSLSALFLAVGCASAPTLDPDVPAGESAPPAELASEESAAPEPVPAEPIAARVVDSPELRPHPFWLDAEPPRVPSSHEEDLNAFILDIERDREAPSWAVFLPRGVSMTLWEGGPEVESRSPGSRRAIAWDEKDARVIYRSSSISYFPWVRRSTLEPVMSHWVFLHSEDGEPFGLLSPGVRVNEVESDVVFTDLVRTRVGMLRYGDDIVGLVRTSDLGTFFILNEPAPLDGEPDVIEVLAVPHGHEPIHMFDRNGKPTASVDAMRLDVISESEDFSEVLVDVTRGRLHGYVERRVTNALSVWSERPPGRIGGIGRTLECSSHSIVRLRGGATFFGRMEPETMFARSWSGRESSFVARSAPNEEGWLMVVVDSPWDELEVFVREDDVVETRLCPQGTEDE